MRFQSFNSQDIAARERDSLEQHAFERAREWDRRFLRLAQEVASWSKDPSTKVGAVIVDERRRIVSVGYNGFPGAIEDNTLYLTDPNLRDQKLLRTVHAEVNAILNAGRGVKGYTMYCTFFPCDKCALMIIAAGIKHIVAPLEGLDNPRWADSFEKTRTLLQEAGVTAALYP